MISQKDLAFLYRRRRAVRAWRWIGGGLLIALAAAGLGLYLRTPELIVPGRAVEAARAGELEYPVVLTMAGLLPATLLALLTVAAAVIGFAFGAAANERRLLKLLDQARQEEKRE